MTHSATARDTKAATNSATASGTSKMVTGLFANSESIERAYEIVSARDYGTADINVVMSDDTRRRYFSDDRQVNTELGRKVEEGGEMGGPLGGKIGTIIPAVIAVGIVALPGVGLVLAGPVAVALAAAGAAGLSFGLMAALHDWGIPEERVDEYQKGIHDGGILMGVRTRSVEDARQIAQQWKAMGAQHVHS
ncbi:MAG TPA: hypothetical protein VJT81_11730 [Burkholderiales bacterium]|nr:hypothetical protein [Burkholderiales bacterium]